MTGFESFFQSAAPYLWLLTLVLIIAMGVALWYYMRQARNIYKAVDTFIQDKHGGGGVEALLARLQRIEREFGTLDVIQTALRELELRQNRSFQSVGLVRFNPFTDMGGDQSFALAIVDTFGNGFVMSSLHGRTATRIYAKNVKRGKATTTVSTEEQASIDQAMRNQLIPQDFTPTINNPLLADNEDF